MITVAVLTLSDKGSKGERDDASGPLIGELLKKINAEVRYSDILPDEKELIKEKLIHYSKEVDLIITTGATSGSAKAFGFLCEAVAASSSSQYTTTAKIFVRAL